MTDVKIEEQISGINVVQTLILVKQTTMKDGQPFTSREYVYGVDGRCLGILVPANGDELPFKGGAK